MRARGLSLIEVVASLVLIATVVTSLLVAHARSIEQVKATRLLETADRMTHELMASWWVEAPGEGPWIEGRFEDLPGWHWTRAVRPYDAPNHEDLNEITLTIFGNVSAVPMGTYTWLERTVEDE